MAWQFTSIPSSIEAGIDEYGWGEASVACHMCATRITGLCRFKFD
jgi:hypothetical protein